MCPYDCESLPLSACQPALMERLSLKVVQLVVPVLLSVIMGGDVQQGTVNPALNPSSTGFARESIGWI